MARPRKDGLDYFPHDTDARNDRKLKIVRATYGLEGYGLYFYLLEEIYTESNFRLDLSSSDSLRVLAKDIGMRLEKLTKFIEKFTEVGLFDNFRWKTEKCLFSNGIKKRAEVVTTQREFWRQKQANRQVLSPEKTQQGKQLDNAEISKSYTQRKPNKENVTKQSKANNKAKHNKTTREELLAPFSPEFQKVFNHFIEMRQVIRRPMTDRAIELAILNLDKLASTEAGKIEILNQSIVNSWQGLFPINKRKEVNRVGAKQQQPKRFEGYQHIIAGTDEE